METSIHNDSKIPAMQMPETLIKADKQSHVYVNNQMFEAKNEFQQLSKDVPWVYGLKVEASITQYKKAKIFHSF